MTCLTILSRLVIMLTQLRPVCALSQKDGGRVCYVMLCYNIIMVICKCEYMHARAIYNVLTQGRTVQNGGWIPKPRQITPWLRLQKV